MEEALLQKHLDVFKENCVDLISEAELCAKLKSALSTHKPLTLKIGFDPTARDIHLGHTVLLRKLRKLQDLGHRVCLIIGDFTAKIGDPSGRSALRPMLSDEAIADNASTYTEQAFKILDKSKTDITPNSTWYKNMNISEFLSLFSCYTVARMLERDDFTLRMKENKPLTILELVYPLVQGYDSVKVNADIEFGGTDQKFNLIVGRHLQEIFNQKPQCIVTMPLLVGLDGGHKMSKSLGNYVGVTEDAKNMFGKLMSIPDEVMWEYFRLLTDIAPETAKGMHPKEAKLLLAQTLVSFYHSSAAGIAQKEEFQRVFSQKSIPQDIPIYKVSEQAIDIIETLAQAKVVASKNEARRILAQEGVSILDANDPNKACVVKEQNLHIPAEGAVILKIGKKRFLKIIRA